MTATTTLSLKVCRHPRAAGHWLGVVTTRGGRCYYADWAAKPADAAVLTAWRDDRKAFLPFFDG